MQIKYYKYQSSGNNFILIDLFSQSINHNNLIKKLIKDPAIRKSDGILLISKSKKYDFNFPYLFDETQKVAKAYGAVCTPDIFGFNNKSLLCYRGRIDSGIMKSDNKEIDRELYNAMIKIKNEGIGPSKQLNSFGCSIKWK